MPIAVLSIDLIARLARLEADMSKAAHIAEKNAKRMDQAFATVARSIAAIGASLSVGAFALMIKSVADAGDQLAKLSTRSGIAVEELSKLQYAASLADVSNEDLAGSLGRLNRILGEAADGGKEATAALARFGIAPGSMDALQAFQQIADRVKNTGDQTKIASALNDIFGRSWQNLVPLIKSGSEGLQQAGDELERMGGVMSGDLAAASERFNDNMTRVGRTLDSLKVQSIGPVIESLDALTTKLDEASKASGGFWSGVLTWATTGGDEESDPSKAIVSIINKLNTLKETKAGLEAPTIANRLGFNTEDIAIVDKQIEVMTQRLEYLKRLNTVNAGSVKDSWLIAPPSGVGITDTPTPQKKGGGSGTKSRAEAVKELTVSTRDYQSAMDSLNSALLSAKSSTLGLDQAQETLQKLMASPEWSDYSETMKWSAIEQASFASGALSAADAQSRLNALMADTPTAQLEAATKDAELLEQALSKAANVTDFKKIKEALDGIYLKSSETTDSLKSQEDALAQQKKVAQELGMTFSSAFEDAIVKGEEFSKVLEGIYQDILRIVVRQSITEPFAKSISEGGIGKWFSGLFTQNANGGVYSSPSLSAYSGGVYSSPQLFKFANGAGVFGEAGPEAIMPLKRGPDGKLGVSGAGSNVTVQLIEAPNSGKGGTSQTSQGANGEQLISVFVEKIRGELIKDVGSGGAFSGAIEGQYGLNRSAGAWR